MSGSELIQAFGYRFDISDEFRQDIIDIRDDNPDVKGVTIRPSDADEFNDLAWRLLGRYIANNTHLVKINLDGCSLTDEKWHYYLRT